MRPLAVLWFALSASMAPVVSAGPEAGPAARDAAMAGPGAAVVAPGASSRQTAAESSETPPAPAERETLRIESLEIEGSSRTRSDILRRYWPLEEGRTASVDEIGHAVAELRASPLFDEVRYSLRAGSERGAVQLRLSVRERGPRLSFGAGYHDLSGWYLIPAELGLDNLGGLGQELRAGARIGYRVAGMYLRYEEPRFLGRELSWGFRFYGDGTQRVYFLDGVEYEHRVERGGYELHLTRTPLDGWGYRLAHALEQSDARDYAIAREDDPERRLERGDRLDAEDLPEDVREGIGREHAARFRAEILRDTRRGGGLREGGLWGVVGAEASVRGRGSFARGFADARLYVPIARGVQAAARAQAAAVGEDAPFYDRYYLGGLYTVRGFPSQSLSPAGGDTRLAAASVELRIRLHGRSERPSIAAVLFADVGEAWSGESPSLRDVSAGAGYGLRIKLPWVGYAGIDAGIPLTESPMNESFHLYGTIGWTY